MAGRHRCWNTVAGCHFQQHFYRKRRGDSLVNIADSTIIRNSVTGSGTVQPGQIVLGGGVNNLSLTENFIEGGKQHGIFVGNFGGGSANSNVVANANSIQNNDGAGLNVDNTFYTGPLDATGNWWGSASGPTIATNPGGTGEDISDPGAHVNFSGFLTAGNDQQPVAPGFQPFPSAALYAVDSSNNLLRFDSAAPGTIVSTAAITGLQAGEIILGIDFRPTTGELFAIGRIANNQGRLYVINPATAAATLRAVLSATPGDDNPYVSLLSTTYGVSFDPVAELAGTPSLRVISRFDDNLRINVANGQVTTDPTISPGALSLNAAAYTNMDLDPATGTVLYGYDFSGDTFVQTATPNTGGYVTTGFSGLVASGNVNLDVQTFPGSRNIMFASIGIAFNPTVLYLVNLTTGLLTPVGEIGQAVGILGGMAVAPNGFFQFSSPSYSIGEAGPFATITINRVGGSEGTATVRFNTLNGVATAPADYGSVDQVVTFNSGETSKTINVPIVNDPDDETNEAVSLVLSAPTGGTLLGNPSTATLTIIDDDLVQTTLTAQTSGSSAALGDPIFDTVTLTGSTTFPPTGTITFQLFGPNNNQCGGSPILTSSVQVNGNGNYVSATFVPTTPGTYTWTVSYSGDPDHNSSAGISCGASGQTVTATGTVLGNISTRLKVESGDNVLIGGFIVTGTQPKKVLLRAIGPSLSQFFSGVLANPTLELYSGDTLLASNDDWQNQPPADRQAVLDTTIPPTNDLESALVRTLPANANYTAIVRGANGGTGIGVIEAYDLDRLADSKLANISTRGFVQTNNDVLIAGTIILGSKPQKVIIRAIGPSLPFGGVLANPTLELRNQNGDLLEANDNWVDSPNKQAIIDSTIPPPNNLESAIVRILDGNGAQYTAIVRGVNNATGIAVVEVYTLN